MPTNPYAVALMQRSQRAGESFETFYAALNAIADNFDVPPVHRDRLLCNAIVHGLRDAITRDQLHRMTPDLTLGNAIALCRMADMLRSRSTESVPSAAVCGGATAEASGASRECVLNGAMGVEPPSAMQPEHMCGITCWHPQWLQKFSNTKSFLVVYGLLGTIQSMAFLYFVVTLSTIEKRFKIPSYTTGIIISGNEISQILLSLILSYAGGQRNRPRWIAWGVVFCAVSCFILALPHFIYGPGDDALHLTAEYMHRNDLRNVSGLLTLNATSSATGGSLKSANKLCTGVPEAFECDEPFSYVPLVLIFVSQFVLGIGTTLYYTLGQTYLDDNTKKTNTPMMLAYAMSLRMLGPVVGFLLGFVSLRMYIDPWSTPLINNKDPRWLGAWWFGWILLGFAMLLFSWLIGMFPKELPKLRLRRLERESLEERPRFMRAANGANDASGDDDDEEATKPFRQNGGPPALEAARKPNGGAPSMKEFPVALMRLLRNKLLMYNILAAVFYILGSSGSITFLSKYMEVQFNKNAADATIVTGPLTLLGMVSGLLLSGWLISKYRPGPRKLFFWNVLVGACYMGGQYANLFLTCDVQTQLVMPARGSSPSTSLLWNLTTACNANCACDAVPYSPVCDETSGTTYFSPCHAGCSGWNDRLKVYDSCACGGAVGRVDTVTEADFDRTYDEVTYYELNGGGVPEAEATANRTRRSALDDVTSMVPGACMAGCAMGFYIYTAVSCVINWLGASAKIGNILLNFRVVSVEDKSFSQGLALMLISLLALIPGPILYGYIIDGSCLIWNSKCGQRGNCQLYDAQQFRYNLNLTAMTLTGIGVFFDVLVWWYGKDVDLYGEEEAAAAAKLAEERVPEFRRRHQPISPLMVKKA